MNLDQAKRSLRGISNKLGAHEVITVTRWSKAGDAIDIVLRTVDDLTTDVQRLGRWKCATCGCRFNTSAHDRDPPEAHERCSVCVENQMLKAALAKATGS